LNKIEVKKSSFTITFENEKISDNSIELYCAQEKKDFSLSNKEGNIFLNVEFIDFNIYEDVTLVIGEKKIILNSIFKNYKLSIDKLRDEKYMTNSIVNASSRGFNNDEIFFVAYNALNIIDKSNHFFGAMVTLLSYRILENPNERSWLIGRLLKEKVEFDKAEVALTPNRSRWIISSTAVLSMLLLLSNKVNNAENILSDVLKSSLYTLNQLSFWNYCLCLFLSALIKTKRNEHYDAGWEYLKVFDFSRKSLSDLYHPRNDWILGQMSDCRALLDLGELGLKCAHKSLGDIPAESRISNIKFSGTICFNPIFERSRNARNKINEIFFSEVEKILNSRKACAQ